MCGRHGRGDDSADGNLYNRGRLLGSIDGDSYSLADRHSIRCALQVHRHKHEDALLSAIHLPPPLEEQRPCAGRTSTADESDAHKSLILFPDGVLKRLRESFTKLVNACVHGGFAPGCRRKTRL